MTSPSNQIEQELSSILGFLAADPTRYRLATELADLTGLPVAAVRSLLNSAVGCRWVTKEKRPNAGAGKEQVAYLITTAGAAVSVATTPEPRTLGELDALNPVVAHIVRRELGRLQQDPDDD